MGKERSNWSRKEELLRQLVSEDAVLVLPHAYQRIEENSFSLDDLLNSLLAGQIVDAEKDERKEAFDKKKYTVFGPGMSGNSIESVGKFVKDDDGKLFVLITCYES